MIPTKHEILQTNFNALVPHCCCKILSHYYTGYTNRYTISIDHRQSSPLPGRDVPFLKNISKASVMLLTDRL